MSSFRVHKATANCFLFIGRQIIVSFQAQFTHQTLNNTNYFNPLDNYSWAAWGIAYEDKEKLFALHWFSETGEIAHHQHFIQYCLWSYVPSFLCIYLSTPTQANNLNRKSLFQFGMVGRFFQDIPRLDFGFNPVQKVCHCSVLVTLPCCCWGDGLLMKWKVSITRAINPPPFFFLPK